MHVLFDLHVPACRLAQGRGKASYVKWLARNTTPVYMQKHYPEIPASIAYPKGRILAEFSYAHRRQYFANQVAWMIALAITEGATHIGLFGVNYSAQSEYERQRGSAEYWLGQLDGRGINVILPEQCTLLAEPRLLYGYESHDAETGLLKDEYKRIEWQPAQTIQPVKPGQVIARAQPPKDVQALIEAEEAENPRPDWARIPEPENEVLVPVPGKTVHGTGFAVTLSAPDNGLGMSITRSDGPARLNANGSVSWPGRTEVVEETGA